MKPRGPLLGGGRPRQPLTHGSHRNLPCGSVLSASNSSDTGFTEIEYSVTSPASCETVTPIGFISGWSVAETVTVPLLFFGSLVVAHGHGKRFRIGLGNGQPLLRSAGHLVRPLHGDGFHGESLTRIAARGKFQSQRIYF